MPIILICLVLTHMGLDAFIWQRCGKYSNKTYPLKTELMVLGVASLVHGAVLLMPVLWDNVLIMGLGYLVSLIVWLMLMMYYLGNFSYCLCGLQSLLYPCTTVALPLRWMSPDKSVGYQANNLPLTLHIVSSPLVYGLSGVVTLFTVLILLLNRSLRRRRASTLSNSLPPLLSLEKLMFRGMLMGFMLLTHSAANSTFFAESVFDKSLTFTHKTIFDILLWSIYGGLLLKHSMTAWRGEKAAVWAIIGFVNLLLVYVGSEPVLEIVLHRQGRRDGKAV